MQKTKCQDFHGSVAKKAWTNIRPVHFEGVEQMRFQTNKQRKNLISHPLSLLVLYSVEVINLNLSLIF